LKCYSLRNFVYFCGRIRSKDLIDMGKRRDDKELAAIASKYDVLKEFIAKEPSTYRAIHAHRLFDELWTDR